MCLLLIVIATVAVLDPPTESTTVKVMVAEPAVGRADIVTVRAPSVELAGEIENADVGIMPELVVAVALSVSGARGPFTVTEKVSDLETVTC